MPPTYWVESLHKDTHLLNIILSTTIQNDTLHFRLFQTHPTYIHLHVFGSLCFPNLTTPHKLAQRTSPCIFLGYPTNHHGYQCLDLSSRKIIISRHVIFDETIFPFKSVKPNEAPSYDFLDVTSTPSPIFTTTSHFSTQTNPSA